MKEKTDTVDGTLVSCEESLRLAGEALNKLRAALAAEVAEVDALRADKERLVAEFDRRATKLIEQRDDLACRLADAEEAKEQHAIMIGLRERQRDALASRLEVAREALERATSEVRAHDCRGAHVIRQAVDEALAALGAPATKDD